MPPVRAVIFDLDGTLVDSLDDIAGALVLALAEHGLPLPGRDAVRRWIGSGARNLVEQAAPLELVDDVLAAFRRHYDAAPATRTALYPGIAELLDQLTGGPALAVLSNKPHDLTVQVADALLFRWRFAAVIGHRPGTPLKPDPSSALAISEALGVAAGDCAFVGDSETDIATGRAAGMRTVAVTWGFRPRHELVAAAPDAVIDEPADLLAALG